MKTSSPTPTPPVVRRSWSSRLRPLVFLAGLTAAVVGSLALVERRPAYLCRHWEEAARRSEPSDARRLIAKLDAYGSFGIPALVRLSAVDEPHVAEAARDALRTRLERATRGDSLADEAAAVQIGDELDSLLRRRSDATPQPLVDVALVLLEATGAMAADRRLEAEQRTKLIEVCDLALRKAATPKSPLATILPPPEPPASLAAAAKNAAATSGSAATALSASSRSVSADSRPSNDVAANASKPTGGATTIASPQPAVAEPRSASNVAARIDPPTDVIVDSAVRPASLAPSTDASGNPLRGGSEPTPKLARPAVAADDPSKLDAWALFALVDSDPRAFTELRRRGFSPREIDVGRHLTNDDALERRRYAQMLPSLGGIDVRPWLLHLCDDADDEVRRIAATIMATTNDPTLLDRLRSMSLDDADEQVREIAARTMGRGPQRQ